MGSTDHNFVQKLIPSENCCDLSVTLICLCLNHWFVYFMVLGGKELL